MHSKLTPIEFSRMLVHALRAEDLHVSFEVEDERALAASAKMIDVLYEEDTAFKEMYGRNSNALHR